MYRKICLMGRFFIDIKRGGRFDLESRAIRTYKKFRIEIY